MQIADLQHQLQSAEHKCMLLEATAQGTADDGYSLSRVVDHSGMWASDHTLRRVAVDPRSPAALQALCPGIRALT